MSNEAQQRRKAIRNALILGVIAVAFYVVYIVVTGMRS